MITVIVGAQWGDEGKGKVIDYLGKRADLVVRFQGGSNAGHTVIFAGKRFKFHLLPSGVVRGKRSLIGAGVVVDPRTLWHEIQEFSAYKKITPRVLGIDWRTQIIMPWHLAIDAGREGRRNHYHYRIGTTGRGIGPAYEDKAARDGIRFADLVDVRALKKKIDASYAYKKQLVETLGLRLESKQKIFGEYAALGRKLKAFGCDVASEVARADDAGKRVLLEGAQGTLLDNTFGTYPFVTSSHPIAGGACIGVGLSPKRVARIEGVVKAYCTRVGEGPFPTEIKGGLAERIRARGNEYGTTTGRARRVGWLDLPLLRFAHSLNEFDAVHLTKLDVLGGLDKIKVCTSYEVNGKKMDTPTPSTDLTKCKPVYVELPGFLALSKNEWRRVVEASKRKRVWGARALPVNAFRYVKKIEEWARVRVKTISLGAAREDTIFVF